MATTQQLQPRSETHLTTTGPVELLCGFSPDNTPTVSASWHQTCPLRPFFQNLGDRVFPAEPFVLSLLRLSQLRLVRTWHLQHAPWLLAFDRAPGRRSGWVQCGTAGLCCGTPALLPTAGPT